MGLSHEEIEKRTDSKIAAKQNQLRGLSDEEIMRIDIDRAKDSFKFKTSDASITHLAAEKEAKRRYVSSGWFWNRLRDRSNYEKWDRHVTLQEIHATHSLIEHFSSRSKAVDKEQISQWKLYAKQLESKLKQD